jgi:hypothetical protein
MTDPGGPLGPGPRPPRHRTATKATAAHARVPGRLPAGPCAGGPAGCTSSRRCRRRPGENGRPARGRGPASAVQRRPRPAPPDGDLLAHLTGLSPRRQVGAVPDPHHPSPGPAAGLCHLGQQAGRGRLQPWDAAGLTDPRVVLAQAIVAEGAGQKRPAHRPAARAAGGRHRHRGIVAPCLRFPLGGAYLVRICRGGCCAGNQL